MALYVDRKFISDYVKLKLESRPQDRAPLEVNLNKVLTGAVDMRILTGRKVQITDAAEVFRILDAQEENEDVSFDIMEARADAVVGPLYYLMRDDIDPTVRERIIEQDAVVFHPASFMETKRFDPFSCLELKRVPFQPDDVFASARLPTDEMYIVDRYLLSKHSAPKIKGLPDNTIENIIENIGLWCKRLLIETRLVKQRRLVLVTANELDSYFPPEDVVRRLRKVIEKDREIVLYHVPLTNADERDALHDRHIWTSHYHLISTKGWRLYYLKEPRIATDTSLILGVPFISKEYYIAFSEIRTKVMEITRKCPLESIYRA